MKTILSNTRFLLLGLYVLALDVYATPPPRVTTVIRACLSKTVSAEMSIGDDGSGNGLIIATNSTLPDSGDYFAQYLYSGAVATSDTTYSIPADGKKWYWVPFDPDSVPKTLTLSSDGGFGGTSCPCTPVCPTCPPPQGACEAKQQGGMIVCDCGDCTGQCPQPQIAVVGSTTTHMKGSGIVVAAGYIIFNGSYY